MSNPKLNTSHNTQYSKGLYGLHNNETLQCYSEIKKPSVHTMTKHWQQWK